MLKKTGDTSELFGMKLFGRGKKALLTLLEERLLLGEKTLVLFTPNPEQVVQAKDDQSFYSYLTQADYLLPDGVGLVWAAKLLAKRGKAEPLAATIPGVDAVTDLLQLAVAHRWQVLIIGGRDYTDTDQIEYPNGSLKLYWTPGYQRVQQPTTQEETELANKITDLQPDLVFVAFGAPYQERWIIEHKHLLEKNHVKLAMSVGGSFDYLLGKVSRAPRWLRSLGLEWLYRLVRQPWRWKRQLRLIRFIGLVGRELVS